MLKFTEKLGDIELTYEGETVQDIVDLKQAMSPSVIRANGELSAKQLYDLEQGMKEVPLLKGGVIR